MPTYKLGVVGRELSFETDESLSKSIGKKLQDPEPQTWIDGGGSMGKSRWRQQEYSREKLIEYKKVRESGGPVASLIESKALINFGTGTEFVAEESDLADKLNNELFPERDNLFINIGKDGFTYPYAVTEAVETRGGDFSHVEFIEPWTMVPKTDDKGRIMQWEQQVKVDGNIKTKPVDPDEVAHFVLNRSSGRDKTGISLIEQNRDEIERFYDNQDSIKNGMQLHGFPQRHISVGREGAGVIDDNELRRVRQRFTGKINEMTAWFTGKDVDVETLETHDFDFQGITENDLKVLTMSFLLPQELANVGSDGLGSGMPAELRKELLLISVQAKQRALANQFIDQMVRPVVEKYTEFDADQKIEIEWQEPLSDKSDKIEDATSMDEYMTTNEVREKAGLPPLDDEEQGESFEPPGQPEQGGGMLPEGDEGGGFFSNTHRRQLQVPDNAVPIDSRSEAPEGASIVEGDRGGLYYVPSGGGGGEGGGEVEDLTDLDEGDNVKVDATIEVIGGEEVDISDDVVEVDLVTENGIAIDHPEHGAQTIQPDQIDGIERAEDGGGEDTTPDEDLNEGGDLAPTPDLLDEQEVQDANEEVFAELGERHGSEVVESTDASGIADAETVTDAFEEWTTSGYWDSHAEPIWEALANAGSGDGEIPDRAQGDNEFREGTQEVADDLVEASREYAEEELFGDQDSITVYRGVSGDIGEELQEAKENGESVEVDPRAMESWSMDDEYAEQFGGGPSGAVMKREISKDDVGLIPALFEPELLEEQEITAVDNGSFEIPAEQIEVS